MLLLIVEVVVEVTKERFAGYHGVGQPVEFALDRLKFLGWKAGLVDGFGRY